MEGNKVTIIYDEINYISEETIEKLGDILKDIDTITCGSHIPMFEIWSGGNAK